MNIKKAIYRHMQSDVNIMRSIARLITFDTKKYEEISVKEDLELYHKKLKDLSNDLDIAILDSSLESDKKRVFTEILGFIYIKYHDLRFITYKKKEKQYAIRTTQ